MERVAFQCPSCDDTVLASPSLAGNIAACPKCRAVAAWPGSSGNELGREASAGVPVPRWYKFRLSPLTVGLLVAASILVVIGIVLVTKTLTDQAVETESKTKLEASKTFPSEDWTHRELADYLAKKGVQVEVAPFALSNKPDLTAAVLTDKSAQPQKSILDDDPPRVLAYLCSDARAAKEQAGAMGEDGFASGRFAFGVFDRKNKALLTKIRAALS